MFDSVDVIFDLPGYIAGYGVSPDSRCNGTLPQKHNNEYVFYIEFGYNKTLLSRYLHVSLRPWPASPDLTNPLDPPPVGRSLERIVIDLARMEVVGRCAPIGRHCRYTEL